MGIGMLEDVLQENKALKDLLFKYLNHVGDMEGITHLRTREWTLEEQDLWIKVDPTLTHWFFNQKYGS